MLFGQGNDWRIDVALFVEQITSCPLEKEIMDIEALRHTEGN